MDRYPVGKLGVNPTNTAMPLAAAATTIPRYTYASRFRCQMCDVSVSSHAGRLYVTLRQTKESFHLGEVFQCGAIIDNRNTSI
jgi:hypothetical protein